MTRRFFAGGPMTQVVPGASLDMGLRLSPTQSPPAAPVVCPECPPCVICNSPPFTASYWTIDTSPNEPTWANGCLTTLGGYGDIQLTPLGTWAEGSRPTSLTVDGPDLSFLDVPYAYIAVHDISNNEIGYLATQGLTPPFVIPLSFHGTSPEFDLGGVWYESDGGSVELCTVRFDCP